MKELKIDPELDDLLTPLSDVEHNNLEKSLLEHGYIGAPIIAWNGYIIDGHERYKICQKYHIEFNYEEINEKFHDKVDVMKFIIDLHFGKRNLTNAQKISIVYKYRDKLIKSNKEKMKLGARLGGMGHKLYSISEEAKTTYTDEQLARLAGVGKGTIGRYTFVMNHGSEDLINKMLSGEESINGAYKKVSSRKQIPNHIQKIKTMKSNGKCNICECNILPILELHHINMVSNGGSNIYDNIELLCPNCHSLLHILIKMNDIAARNSLIDSLNGTVYEKVKDYF